MKAAYLRGDEEKLAAWFRLDDQVRYWEETDR